MDSGGFETTAGVAHASLAALRAALDNVAAVPLWQLGEHELGVAVEELARAEARLQAVQVAVLGEAISRGVPADRGAKGAGVWLRHHVALTPAQAAARARLAEDLSEPELAPARRAFAAGDFSAAHAGVIARTIKAVQAQPKPVDLETRVEAQELLVETALRIDAAQLGKAGMRIRYRLDPDAADRLAKDEDAQERAREAYLAQERDGMWHLAACLPPVAGAALHAVLDPLAKPDPAGDGGPDPRSAKQRMADAIKLLAETTLAARAGSPNALPSRGGAHTRMVLLGSLDTLLARAGMAGAAPGELETGEPGGWPVSPLTVQELACDAEVVPILTDDSGRPLDVGNTVYPFPLRIRRAIEARDRHCTFEGCNAKPAWCHTHHLIRHPDGPTSEANGTLLCGRHHRFVHARHWQGRIADGHVVWRPPNSNEEHGNAYDQQFEQLLRQLALRWLARNPHLRSAS
jgi:Domain of unknown function (DUF222)